MWRNGDGVIVMPVVTKACNDEAECREAAIISLRDSGQYNFYSSRFCCIGLSNLLNSSSGSKGHERWSDDDWTELGILQLLRAFSLYRRIHHYRRFWYLWDLPLTPDQLHV